MRILYIVFNQPGKGTYWRAFHWARYLAARGHAVTLMVVSPEARLRIVEREEQGVHIIETPDLLPGPLRSGWDPWDVLRRIGWLKGRRFDIVHAFEGRPVVIFPALAARRGGARFFMDWCDWFGRGGSVEERPNPLVRAVLRPVETFFEEHYRTEAEGTTVINSLLREHAIALGVPPETIRLIRNGSDASIPLLDKVAARAQLDLPMDLALIGFSGGTYLPDAELMARAFNIVVRARPDARLLLVGFNRDMSPWLEQPDSVILIPRRPQREVYSWLSACDLCWLPLTDSNANRGRWPMKLNDYLTVGRPVVSTAVGDLGDVTAQHGFGVASAADPEAFAAATLRLLDNPAAFDAYGAAARYAAVHAFNWDTLAAELETFYRDSTLSKR